MAPKTVEDGFFKADSRNLPKVTSEMLVEFFISPAFLAPQTRNRKTERSCRASYSDDAVGYVQVNRHMGKCTVKAGITPEHRTQAKAYTVICIIDEEEDLIEHATCEDCPAGEGGCKHTVAFVTWLHRRSEEPAVTSVTCYWKKSKLSAVGSTLKTLPMKEVAPPTPATISKEEDKVFWDLFCETLSKDKCEGTLFSQLKEVTSSSIHHLLIKFKKSHCVQEGEIFIEFCWSFLNPKVCMEIANATIDQSDSPLWFDQRYGRITASKLHEASRCNTANGTLVNTILGARKIKDNAAMKRGRKLEPEVLKVIGKKRKLKIARSGLILHPEFPEFGASPDGVTRNYVIEVKCPVNENSFKSYFENSNSEPSVKHKTQVLMQMFMAKKQKGLFCVAAPDFEVSQKVTILEVNYDETFLKAVIESARIFWLSYVFPELYKHILTFKK